MYPQDRLFHVSIFCRKHDIYSYLPYAQKLTKVIIEEAGISAQGLAGLQLGAGDIIIVITYNKRIDGRFDFDKLGWKNFIEGKKFVVDRPVLITLRKMNQLHVLIEFQLI